MPAPNMPYFTVTEAAQELGITTGRVRQLLGSGLIIGVKTNWSWMIPATEVERRKRDTSTTRSA